MFGRKPPSDSPPPAGPSDRFAAAPSQPSAPRPVAPAAPRPVSADGDAAPRPVPATPRRPAEPVRSEPAATPRDMRKLIVGHDIALSGEINACDHLIVEGTVEAMVKECHRIEIAETGLFRGTVEIDEADIGGRFEGALTVRGRLTVRASGRIEGKIQYGELAVEAGGTLDGEIHGLGLKALSRPTAKAGIRAPATPAAEPEIAEPPPTPVSGGAETQAEASL